jgi:bacterioferritin (cytochrome b1)
LTTSAITRPQLIAALNEDLSREYQAIIAYVVYSQVLKGAEYMAIAKELETHAQEELQHAITIAKHIDYLGGTPAVTWVSDDISGQTCPNGYTITRTYKATDQSQNTATCAQVITVYDNTKPILTIDRTQIKPCYPTSEAAHDAIYAASSATVTASRRP